MSSQIILQTIASGLLLGFIYSLLAIGITLIWGVMGFVNFAHADFMMLSMFAAYWAYALLNVDPLISLPVIALLLFIMGVLTYKLTVSRVVDAPVAIQLFVSFGLMIFLRGSAQFLWTADYRMISNPMLQGRLQVFGLFLGIPQLLAGIGAALIDGLLYWFIQKTETGRTLRAVAEDKVAASLMGIDSERMYALAWGMAVGSAGIAGALISNYYYTYPDVGVIFGVMGLVIVSMAGFGNILGAFAMSLVCGVVVSVSGLIISPAFKYAVVFILYLCILVLRRSQE